MTTNDITPEDMVKAVSPVNVSKETALAARELFNKFPRHERDHHTKNLQLLAICSAVEAGFTKWDDYGI
jgi:hypothetical protein